MNFNEALCAFLLYSAALSAQEGQLDPCISILEKATAIVVSHGYTIPARFSVIFAKIQKPLAEKNRLILPSNYIYQDGIEEYIAHEFMGIFRSQMNPSIVIENKLQFPNT